MKTAKPTYKKVSVGTERHMVKKSEKRSDSKMGTKPPMKPTKRGK